MPWRFSIFIIIVKGTPPASHSVAGFVRFRNAIHNLTSPTYKQMEERSLKRYDEREAKNAQLLQAFNDKKLKSKSLIKTAKALKKKQKKEKVVKEIATA